MSSNVGADSNPSDYNTSFVEETLKNDPDVGKAADFSNSGGETKQAKTQGKALYASFFKDNHILDDKSKLEYIPPEKGEFVVHLMRLIW